MKKWLNKILFYNLQFAENEQEIKYKFIFLNSVYFFASIVAFLMGFIRWHTNDPLIGCIDFSFAIVSMVLLYYLRRHKEKIELLSSFALIFSFVLFLGIYLLAPSNTTRLSLFFLLSASAFFLKGRRAGFFWMLFILLSIILGHVFSIFDTEYSNFDIFTTGIYLVALFFIMNNYEIIKEEQHRYLEHLNLHLTEEVQARTKELEEANKFLEVEKRLFKELYVTDQLTGLSNRYKLRDLFEFEKKQILRYNADMSVMLIDIDHFKLVNDNYGHNMGDAVLKKIATLLKESVRESDIVARWGGDEFIIITPKTTLSQSLSLAEALRQRIKKHLFEDVGYLTASFGVTAYKNMDTLEKIIQRADQALYNAKESGRDNVKSLI
jgi:diguanylate cyclase (GGDEF)-like protein